MLKCKRLPEEPFSFIRTLKQERERERKRMQVIKGLEQAEKAVNTSKCNALPGSWVSAMADNRQICTIFTATTRFFGMKWY